MKNKEKLNNIVVINNFPFLFSNNIFNFEVKDYKELKEFENNKKIVSLAYYYFYNNKLSY